MHPLIYELVWLSPAYFVIFFFVIMYFPAIIFFNIVILIILKLLLENRRFKDKKEVVEPEADPERDQRTVFAYQVEPCSHYFMFLKCYRE